MIIKSMGRKAAGKPGSVGARGGGVFSRLVAYMTRSDDQEKAESVIWHGFYGHAGMSAAEVIRAFEENAARLKERKNGNVLYHEILSFSKGHTLAEHELIRSVTDIGQEYLRQRAGDQLAFGAVHRDTDHIHLHLMISANAVGKSERVRLTKKAFADIQKSVEAYTLERYGELGQTRVYDKARQSERLKTQSNEQAMKARTGGQSRKEGIKSELHQLFERAQNRDELEALLKDARMTIYTRGKNVGVVVRDEAGEERKHRFSTLGLDTHYRSTLERFGANREDSSTPKREEKTMATKRPGMGADAWGDPGPSAPEVVIKEFVTGKLHPHWHGEQEEPSTPYTDRILADIERRAKELQWPEPPTPKKPPAKDRDDER